MRWWAIVAALAFGSEAFAQGKAAARPKHVLMLIADDLGLTLGCYGDPVAKTPNCDKLAAKGVRFTRAYATVASCSPSRATIYSGLFTHQNGQYGLAHAAHKQASHPWVQSLPNLLRAAGYWTGIIAKVHVLPQSAYDWEAEIKSAGRNPVELAKKSREFIGKREKRPFFLVVGFTDPHRAAVGFGNEPFAKDPHRVTFDPKKVPVPAHLPDCPEVRRDLAEYYESVARFDRGVGLILQELQESGELENTLILVLSDNGIPFPGAKTTLYGAGTHLPLIVSAPGHREKGVANPTLASWVDLAPTVLDWTGAKGPKYALPGRSLMPLLARETPGENDAVFGSHQMHEITMYYPMRSIVTNRHKLIVNLDHKKDFPFPSDLWASPSWQAVRKEGLKTMGKRSVDGFLQRPKEELYDLSTDPDEVNNLASDPSRAEVLADLRRRLRAWQDATNDPWQILYREEDPKFNKK